MNSFYELLFHQQFYAQLYQYTQLEIKTNFYAVRSIALCCVSNNKSTGTKSAHRMLMKLTPVLLQRQPPPLRRRRPGSWAWWWPSCAGGRSTSPARVSTWSSPSSPRPPGRRSATPSAATPYQMTCVFLPQSPGVDFTNMFMHSFYPCRSQKRKMASGLIVIFALWWSMALKLCIKCWWNSKNQFQSLYI